MEFIGQSKTGPPEVRLRMPKFGNISNMQHSNIVDNFEKRETAIRSKLRNLMREGIARPVKRIRQGIFDLLKLHPLPRYCGPFTGPIDGHWNYNYFYRLSEEYSNDADKHFIYFVTFIHPAAQSCGKWTFDANKTNNKMKPKYTVESANATLSGPASTLTKTIVYPCEHGNCWIECPCNLCTSCDEPCDSVCAKMPCGECDQQCLEHKCELDRTYSEKDSFTIPFYFQDLDEEARTNDNNLSAYSYGDGRGYGYDYEPEKTFIKYAGIPRSCTKCQVDLLDHEVHHNVLHYRCKFCRKSLRLWKNNPVNYIQLMQEKRKNDICDTTTCSFCYKNFTDSAIRKYHEKTEHIDNEKPFKCVQCPKTYTSLIGLNHHNRVHDIAPNEYSCKKCGKIFTAERTLKRHIKSVHEIQIKARLQCDLCEKSFTRADNLTRHFQEVHSQSSLNTQYIRQLAYPLKCDHCSTRYKRRADLENHILSSHVEVAASGKLMCEICLKSFTDVKNKRRHTNNVHNKISRNYECKYCEKSFGRKDNLDKHVKQCHST